MEEEWRRSSKCEGCSYSVCVCMGQRLTDRHAQRERERERQTETEIESLRPLLYIRGQKSLNCVYRKTQKQFTIVL